MEIGNANTLQEQYVGPEKRLHPRNLPLPLNNEWPQDIAKLFLFLHWQRSNVLFSLIPIPPEKTI